MAISKIGTNSIDTSAVTQPKVASGVAGSGPAFSAYNNATQSINASTATIVQLQVKEFDTATCFNNTSGTVTLNGLSVPAWSFCPNVAGYYQISASVQMLLGSQGQSGEVYINKNGGVALYGNFAAADNNAYVSANASQLLYLNGTGDYISMSAWQSSGAARNIQAGGAQTRLGAVLVRSA